MAYFPFFMEAEGMDCLIVGGGMVALRKVQVLLEYGAAIRVVAPDQTAEIQALAGEGIIRLYARGFEFQDLDNAQAVIAATSDEELNRQISAECRKRRIPVNVVDVKEECSFIFPALVKDGDIVVGISTGGASPAMARQLKQDIREAIPKGAGEVAAWLKSCRPFVKEQVDSQPVREAVFKELTRRALSQGRGLTQEEVYDIVRKVPITALRG